MFDTNQCGQLRSHSAKLPQKTIGNIEKFILGAVYGYCVKNADSKFSVRILFGEKNRNWDKTPLIDIYEYYIKMGVPEDAAVERAGKDVGHLLKRVLHEDKKYRYQIISGYVNEYVRL